MLIKANGAIKQIMNKNVNTYVKNVIYIQGNLQLASQCFLKYVQPHCGHQTLTGQQGKF